MSEVKHTPDMNLDATVVGNVVELRYADHAEAFKQLYALRRMTESHADLLKAAKRALTVLKAQGESLQRGNVLEALDTAIRKATT